METATQHDSEGLCPQCGAALHLHYTRDGRLIDCFDLGNDAHLWFEDWRYWR